MKRGTPIDRRPVFSIIMIGGLAVLLPLLAVLQYRWIGQVSQNEATRLRRSLAFATERSVRDINDEFQQITEAFLLFQRPSPSATLEEVADNFARELGNSYESWQATSLNAALLREVYVYNLRNRELRHFDPNTNALVGESHSITRLAMWFNDPGDIPGRFLSGDTFADGQLWVVSPIPVFTGSGRQQRGGPVPRPPENLLLFEINPEVFWGEVIPTIMANRFDQLEYRVAIEDVTNGRFLYTSDPTITPAMMADVDASPSVTPQRRRFGLIGPELQVRARHELGSLADAVEAARRRNLAVGFGILALLGVTGAMIIVWSERVRSVGRLQMEFAAGISHELRTPLATIRTAAHNIAAGIVKDPEQIREYAEIVQTEGRRLSGIVDQTIQFAQVEAGRRHYDMEAVSVQDVIDQAVQNVRALAQEGGNAIEVRRRGHLPRVMADPTSLTHCLANLLTNAVKFGSPGAPVTIDASHDPRKDRVRISVHNQGPGIDVDELPHLFEPFFRGHDTSRIPGSGLGLSLVRRMMTRQKGEVTVETEPGAGATFTLHIPAAPGETQLPESGPA